MSQQQQREWDWLFLSLWIACGKNNTGCLLNIPQTILLKDGEPRKWLGTTQYGHVTRISFGKPTKSKTSRSNRCVQRMKRVRDALESTARSAGHMESDPVCVAWYIDKGKELLDIKTLDMLIQHDEWRVQVLALQSYVKPKELHHGEYHKDSNVETGAAPTTAGAGKSSLDALTKSMCQYSETAYANMKELADLQDPDVERATELLKFTRIHVTAMTAEFIIDESDVLWYSHSPEIWVQVVEPGPSKLERINEVHQQARAAITELKNLLHAAEVRGVSTVASYAHFDRKGTGVVDLSDLMEGLEELGIKLSEEAAGFVMQQLSRSGRGLLTRQNLIEFVRTDSNPGITQIQPKQLRTRQPKTSVINRAAVTSQSLHKLAVDQLPKRSRSASSLEGVRAAARNEMRGGKSKKRNGSRPLAPWARDGTKKAYHELKAVKKRLGPAKVKAMMNAMENGPSVEPQVDPVTGLDKEEMTDSDDNGAIGTSVKQRAVPFLALNSNEAQQRIQLNTFRLNSETTIGYCVLEGNPFQVHGGDTFGIQKARQLAAVDRGLAGNEVDINFMLTVVPDLLQTPESLEEYFTPLLNNLPRGKILIISLPGMPGTEYPQNVELNNEFLSSCMSTLLLHLEATGEWEPPPPPELPYQDDLTLELIIPPSVPHMLVGLGNGANIATYFSVEQLQQPEHAKLLKTLRAMILLNPFAHLGHGLNRAFHQLRRLQIGGDAVQVEKVAHLSSVLFSQRYLGECGRQEAMATFYSTRRSLQQSQASDGAARLIHGATKHRDLRPELTTIPLPMLLLHASENSFVVPLHTEPYVEAFQAVHRAGAGTVKDPRQVVAAAPGQIVAHFGWLKSGHEIMQERQTYVLDLLESLIKTACLEARQEVTIDPGTEWYQEQERLRKEREHQQRIETNKCRVAELEKAKAKEAETQRQFEASIVWSDEEEPTPLRRNTADLLADPDTSPFIRSLLLQHSLRGLPMLLEERGLPMEGSSEDMIERLDKWNEAASLAQARDKSEQGEKAEAAEQKRGRRAGEARAREERAAERKRRAREKEREAQAEKLRMDALAAEQEAREGEERQTMYKEDVFSKQANEDARQLVIWRQGADHAVDQIRDLKHSRAEDEEEEQRLEEGMVRAQRQQARKMRIKMQQDQYLADQLTLEGDRLGYALDDTEVRPVREAVSRLKRDIFSIRGRKMEAMLKQRAVQARYQSYHNHLVHVEQSMRQLQRALKNLEEGQKSGRTKKTRGVANREMKKMKKKEAELHLERGDLQLIYKDCSEELDVANLVVQRLAAAQDDKEKIFFELLKKIKRMFADRSTRVVQARNDEKEKEDLKNDLCARIHAAGKRVKRVRAERERLKGYRKKWVDSDVWVPGVYQRINTAELQVSLAKEETELVTFRKEAKDHVRTLKKDLVDLSLLLVELCHDANVLRDQRKRMEGLYKSGVEQSVTEELESRLQDEAEKSKELERAAHETELLEHLQSQGWVTIADQVRHKPHSQRTNDEKKWVGLDVLVNPQKYSFLNEMEAEEIKMDPTYQTTLTAEDCRRILILPEQIQLALPFLQTADEIEAHRLIQTFTFNNSPDKSRNADLTINDLQHLRDRVTVEEKKMAQLRDDSMETLNAELVRLRAWRIRRKDPIDRTPEEDEWLAVDKELHPRLFLRRTMKDSGAGGDLVNPIDSDPEDEDEHEDPRKHKRQELTPEEKRAHELETFAEKKAREKKAKDNWLERNKKGEDVREHIYAELAIKWRAEEEQILQKHAEQRAEEEQAQRERDRLAEEELKKRMREWEWEEQELPVVCPFDGDKCRWIMAADGLSTDEEWRVRRLLEAFWSIPAEKLEAEEARLEDEYISELQEEQRKRMQRKDRVKKVMSRRGIWGVSVELNERGLSRAGTDKELVDRLLQAMKEEDDEAERQAKEAAEKQRMQVAIANKQHAGFIVEQMRADEEGTDSSTSSPEQLAAEEAAEVFHLMDVDGSGSVDKREMMTALLENKQVTEYVQHCQTLSLLLSKSTFAHTFDAMDSDGEGDGEVDLTEFVSYIVDVVHKRAHSVTVVNSLAEVPAAAPKGKVLITQGEEICILNKVEERLNARESRTHQFMLPVGRRVLEMSISVVFKGVFGAQGYRLGRLASMLYRVRVSPEDPTKMLGVPEPVGHTPYDRVNLSQIDELGKIVVIHNPQRKPLPHDYKYQVVMGAPSAVVYSMQVNVVLADDAEELIHTKVDEAQSKMKRLPHCIKEIDALWQSIRLSERKLKLVNRVCEDAQNETVGCELEISRLTKILKEDDELLELEDEERAVMEQKISTLELQFTRWCKIYTTRQQEQVDVKKGLKHMEELHRKRIQERHQLEAELKDLRVTIPQAAMSLFGEKRSVDIGHSIGAEAVNMGEGDEMIALDQKFNNEFAPAEKVRRKFARGEVQLTAEEQEWASVDRILNPGLYEWLDEREAKEQAAEHRQQLLAMAGEAGSSSHDGQKDKKGNKKGSHKKRNVPYSERFSRKELQRIVKSAWPSLSRHEMQVRKILNRFPDQAGRAKQGHERQRKAGEGSLEFAQETRDKFRQARARGQLKSLTQAELRWIEIDKIRHPELHGQGKLGHAGLGKIREEESEEEDDSDLEWAEEMRADKRMKNEEQYRLKLLQSKQEALDATINQSNLVREGDLEHQEDERLRKEQAAVTEEAIKVFSLIDKDKSGFIDMNEMMDSFLHDRDVVKFIQASPELRHLLNQNNFIANFKAMDGHHGDGKITCAEFVGFCKDTVWECPFGKDDLERVYCLEPDSLESEEEVEVHMLLVRFEGPPSKFARNNYMEKCRLLVHNNLVNAEVDVDSRARTVLKEVDAASSNSNEFMDSDVLTGSAQRFPTVVLRLELERELDRLLLTQIFEREQAMPPDEEIDDENDISDDDEEALEQREQRRRKQEEMRAEAEKADPNLKYRLKQKVEGMHMKTPQQVAMENRRKEQELQPWKPCLDIRALHARQHDLSTDIERVKKEIDGKPERREEMTTSKIALSVIRGGFDSIKRHELMRELQWEFTYISQQISLVSIDKELHEAYEAQRSGQLHFVTQALHGYPQFMDTNKALVALERQSNTIIAKQVAVDLIDDILDWMLEGWHFGERISEREVSGFVPSIKRSGPLTVFDIQRLEQKKAKQKDDLELEDEYKKKRTAEMMGTPLEKWEPIELQAQELQREKKAVREGSDLEHQLNETEQNLRFGLFCLTLMYFRAMTLIRRERDQYDDQKENEQLGVASKGVPGAKQLTEERQRIQQEAASLKMREDAMQAADSRAAEGASRKAKREAKEKMRAKQKLWEQQRLVKSEELGALVLQKLYRGHLGRKAASKWNLRRAEIDAQRALQIAACLTLQRVYRGRLGRIRADERRAELAAFIAQIRAEEAKEEEEQYWRTHPYARHVRDIRSYVDRIKHGPDGKPTMGL